MKTTFLKCVKVDDGKAMTVHAATKAVLADYHVPDEKVTGLGSDGASAMSSELAGVNGLMKRDNPFCVFVHCVAHRLALVVSQARAGIQDMSTGQEILSG